MLPHKEIEQLRAEIEQLKKNPLGEGVAQQNLLDAITTLSTNLTKLNSVLSGANEEMLKAYHDTSAQEELRKVRAENAKIAHGIVAVAKLVGELEERMGNVLPRIEEFLDTQKRANALASANSPSLQLHEEDLATDLTRGSNPFSDAPVPPPATGKGKPVPDMDVPPPPPAFR